MLNEIMFIFFILFREKLTWMWRQLQLLLLVTGVIYATLFGSVVSGVQCHATVWNSFLICKNKRPFKVIMAVHFC